MNTFPVTVASQQLHLQSMPLERTDIDGASHQFSALVDERAHTFLEMINDLPSHILPKIFCHLDLKSKKVLASSHNKSLRDAVRATITSVQVPGSDLADALRKFPCVERISVYSSLTEQDVARIEGNKEKVLHLNLSGCNQFTDPGISDKPVKQVLEGLYYLNLSIVSQITDAAFTALAEKCPNLTSLDLSGCLQLTDTAIVELAEKCPNLTSLNLSGCRQLTHAAIVALVEKCPNLTSLNLKGCVGLTDVAIVALAQNCPNLNSLDLRGCRQLTDAALTALAENYTELTCLSLSENHFTQDAIQELEMARRLTFFNLREWIELG